ncbi:MAG: XRE family transcriptional regulator [Propionibacteriaceae bacterium]|jgi:DNA-directed RNA polymerase specialized sigma24 family protein|nr:XRE family transcriptional regulator [Propionibacteriaceae bacterium]
MSDKTLLTAQARRSGKWWAVRVPEVGGLFTQARRLDEVEALVKNGAALLTGDPEDGFAVVVDPVWEDAGLAAVVAEARVARDAAGQAERRAAVASREAVAGLRAEGLTTRDVARLLGVSPGRVSQLAA